MTRSEHAEIIAQLFDAFHHEFGNLAPQIIGVMVKILDGRRMTFPSLEVMYREERNRRIRNEFLGANYEELAIKYGGTKGLTVRQVRNIIHGGNHVIHRID